MKKSMLLALFTLFLPAQASSNSVRLEIVGTGDGLEILRAIASHYTKANPDVVVEVPPSIGSGGGIAAVGSGRAVLGRVARQLTEVEREAGISYTPIARMPSTFFTHPNVNVESITLEQLVDVYRGRITNWKDVGGPDHPIRVIRREDIDSTLIVLRNTMPGWKTLAITERSKIALTTQESIETAQKVPGAIGFAPYSKLLENGLKVLKIGNLHPLEPDYPSTNELALIHTERTINKDAANFLNFSVGDQAGAIISAHGAVPVGK